VASGQVHGSVFIAVTLAIITLAVLARLSVSGIGPFTASVDEVQPSGAGLAVTLTVTNDGDSTGRTTCRLNRTGDRGTGDAAFVTTPELGPGETRTFSAAIIDFGADPVALDVSCRTP
jgi:hypothetical protein